MRRKPEDFFEELLKRATQREEQGNDDVTIYYVRDGLRYSNRGTTARAPVRSRPRG